MVVVVIVVAVVVVAPNTRCAPIVGTLMHIIPANNRMAARDSAITVGALIVV